MIASATTTTSSNLSSTIQINPKYVLHRFKSIPENFLNRTIALIGASNSGKSICIKDILATLKDDVSLPIVFNSTELTNKTFGRIIQAPFIYTSFDMKILKNIWKRQEEVLQIYNLVNDAQILKSILLTFSDDKRNNIRETIVDKLNIMKDEYINSKNDKLCDKIVKTELYIIKKTIHDIKKKINAKDVFYRDIYRMLDSNQKNVIKCININPHIVIVLDDCAAELKQFLRDETIRKLFYQSRHLKITLVIAAQDETDIEANLRKNVHLTFFCDMNCTYSFFDRKCNGFGTLYKKIARECADVLFSDNINCGGANARAEDNMFTRGGGMSNTTNPANQKHLKLIYNKEEKDKFFWYKADITRQPTTFIFDNYYITKFLSSIGGTTTTNSGADNGEKRSYRKSGSRGLLGDSEGIVGEENLEFYQNKDLLENIIRKL
jgi:hypothetical protein